MTQAKWTRKLEYIEGTSVEVTDYFCSYSHWPEFSHNFQGRLRDIVLLGGQEKEMDWQTPSQSLTEGKNLKYTFLFKQCYI